MKIMAGVLMIAAATLLVGCYTEDRIVYLEDLPPTRPTGVISVTGDEAVYIYWDPNGEPDLSHYRVYRGFSATGTFTFIGSTTDEAFSDFDVINGETYYYAISAVDDAGQESGLSVENVHDTPRPEGYNVILYDNATNASVSGFDFSRGLRVPFNDASADVYVDRDPSLGLFVNAADLYTDLQDMGFTDNLDEIGWSPTNGWSPVGWTQIIEGHTYVVWTNNDHYAKLRAVTVADTWVQFDWAYQVDTGNPELVKPAHDSGYLDRPSQLGSNLVNQK